MKIHEITLTSKELIEAVREWLKTKGLEVDVANVQKSYTKGFDWKVEAVAKLEYRSAIMEGIEPPSETK